MWNCGIVELTFLLLDENCFTAYAAWSVFISGQRVCPYFSPIQRQNELYTFYMSSHPLAPHKNTLSIHKQTTITNLHMSQKMHTTKDKQTTIIKGTFYKVNCLMMTNACSISLISSCNNLLLLLLTSSSLKS